LKSLVWKHVDKHLASEVLNKFDAVGSISLDVIVSTADDTV